VTSVCCRRRHRDSRVDVVSLHDAAEVLVGGEDAVEAVVVDIGYNHLWGGGGGVSQAPEYSNV